MKNSSFAGSTPAFVGQPSNFVGCEPPPALDLNAEGEQLFRSIAEDGSSPRPVPQAERSQEGRRSVTAEPTAKEQLQSEGVLSALLNPSSNPVTAQRRIMESMRSGMIVGSPASVKRTIDQNAFGVTDEVLDSRDPEFSLPWDFRSAQDRTVHIDECSFVTTTHFWMRVQWALQFAFLSCLPAAVLGMLDSTKTFFKAPYLLLSMSVVCTNKSLGRAFFGILDVLKAVLLVWIVLTIIFAVHINTHWALWGAVYLVGNFLIAFLCDNIVAKNAALLFTVGMVTNFTSRNKQDDEAEGLLFPTLLARDVCIGIALGVASAVLPKPRSEYKNAEANFSRLVIAASMCTMGLSESLFCENNMHRTANLVKVRSARAQMVEELEMLKESVLFARYEPVSGLRIAELAARAKLLEEVGDTLDSLIAVVGFVQANPRKFHDSPLTSQFRHHFGHGFKYAGEHIDKFLHILTWRRKNSADMRVLQHVEDRINRDFSEAMDKVMRALNSTLEELNLSPSERVFSSTALSPAHEPFSRSTEATAGFHGAGAGRSMHQSASNGRFGAFANFEMGIEEWSHFPRVEIGFFTFNLLKVVTLLKTFEEPDIWGLWRSCKYTASAPLRTFQALWQQVVDLFAWTLGAQTQLLAAVKLSFCMTSAIAVILYIDVGDPIFGPAVIAFVAGGDAAQTVQTALTQLMATVLGNVFGYLLASISPQVAAQVAFVVLVALLTGFFRSSKIYGLAAFYAQFAAFGSIRPDQEPRGALIAIQQNTACICWYVVIAAAVFPNRPSQSLFNEMKRGFEKVKRGIASMEQMLSRNDLASIEVALELNAKQKSSIRVQKQHLAGAVVEPSLASHPFPAHLVDKTIDQQTRIVALLSPLSLAWGLLATCPEQLSTDTCVVALLPHLRTLVNQVEKLMGLLILVLDRDVATLTPLLVKASMKLQQISVDLSTSESMESFRVAIQHSDAEEAQASHRLDSESLGSPPLLTVIYCCTSLAHELFQLYLSVSEMRHALQAI